MDKMKGLYFCKLLWKGLQNLYIIYIIRYSPFSLFSKRNTYYGLFYYGILQILKCPSCKTITSSILLRMSFSQINIPQIKNHHFITLKFNSFNHLCWKLSKIYNIILIALRLMPTHLFFFQIKLLLKVQTTRVSSY